jgi:hypothetical protein
LACLVIPPKLSILQIFALIGLGVFVLRGAENGHFLNLATIMHICEKYNAFTDRVAVISFIER